MKWLHLNLYFHGYEKRQKLSNHQLFQIAKYLKEIINNIYPEHANKYFYLFEAEPHLFLAFEILERDLLGEKLKKKIISIKPPKIIKEWNISQDTKDDLNGEQQVNFYMAATNYALWKILSGKYKYGYDQQDESKMLHCFWNMQGKNWAQELLEYFNCALHRGAITIEYLDRSDFKVRIVNLLTKRKLKVKIKEKL